ncbi:retropepsin-like domain-containing protein [Dyella telluris]|uniref:Retropepsin-like domain-containing protein n=2 Tax=Dyella telluris TaxID=2763498 RepID=A0A7G8QAV1_9GAMM|nr:retropepsin-like domain-containing protein [Dyella telluris]
MAALYQQNPDPAVHVLAAMALERIHFNLDKATEDARLCEKELIATQPAVALYCARFLSGNLRLAQGDAAADAEEQDIVRRFAGHVPQRELDRMSTYVASQRDTPPFRLSRPDGDFTIPLLQSLRDNRGAVMLEAANGSSVRMTLDTGAGAIVMDMDTAVKLGVRALGTDGKTRGLLSKDVPVTHGILEQGHLGPVTLENAPVEIVPNDRRLIGLDVLRLLGAFRVTRRELNVYGKTGTRPTCNEPMLVSSDLWGQTVRTVVALSVNGNLRASLLDTGSSFYLNGNQAAMDEVEASSHHSMRISDIGASRLARVKQATANVIVSGQPIHMTFGVFPDADLAWSYILGSGALGDMDFYMDFEQRHTCLLLHDNLR